jgi:phage baseplate assembly protein V
MNRLLNAMRAQAQMAGADRAQTKIGLISGYDATNYSAKVTLQPEGIETGWIPCLSPWVGNGWGMFCPPSIGDMVEVQFEQGGSEAAFACMRFFNDQDRPLTVAAGEFWLVHKSGGFLKLTNDGKVLINGQAEIDLTAPALNITISGNATLSVGGNITSSATVWNHAGPMNIAGNTTVTGTLLSTGAITGQGGMAISGGTGASVAGSMVITGGNVTADGIGLKTHKHGGVQGGLSDTGVPK